MLQNMQNDSLILLVNEDDYTFNFASFSVHVVPFKKILF